MKSKKTTKQISDDIFAMLVAENLTPWEQTAVFACGFTASLFGLDPPDRKLALDTLIATLRDGSQIQWESSL